MTTWSFKAPVLAALSFTLSACLGTQGFDLQSLGKGGAAEPQALTQTEMANGAFTLVAPAGFCIDKHGLNQRFALLARCGALGVESDEGGAPVGILTVSVTPAKGSETIPTPEQTADAAQLARVHAPQSAADAVIFRADGPPPLEGLDTSHWRATTRKGSQIVGISLYGPEGGRAASSEGRDVIQHLIERSHAGS